MFSLQKGMKTLRVAESLQLSFGEGHFVIDEIASLAVPLHTQHQISGPQITNNCSSGCHGEIYQGGLLLECTIIQLGGGAREEILGLEP